MKLFPELLVWRDPEARSGPECMAVDELLLRNLGEVPILRLYEWSGDWVSVGYFGDVEAAQDAFGEEVEVVKRWTGGGVVDHRHDVTYSLMIPRNHPVAQERGVESYRVIHQGVADALREVGCDADLVKTDSSEKSEQCFERPVAWDVVDGSGKKLAGAGQRRTRWGLLHQGSVQVAQREAFCDQLEGVLTESSHKWSPSSGALAEVRVLAQKKYSR